MRLPVRRRGLIVFAGIWAVKAQTAARESSLVSDIPSLIAAARSAVLPIGQFDPLASPRFRFRGTAFAVGNGHHVVTNHHVIAGPDVKADAWVLRQQISGDSDHWRRLEVVSQDPVHDLALLRVADERPLPALRLAPDERLREGTAVLLMGFPVAGLLGFQPVTHRGMVSSIAPMVLPAANAGRLDERAIASLRRGAFDIVQLDATAYPGNSGGPVLDAETGEVLAVVNMVLTKGGREGALQHPSGISYAIPGRWVRALLTTGGR